MVVDAEKRKMERRWLLQWLKAVKTAVESHGQDLISGGWSIEDTRGRSENEKAA